MGRSLESRSFAVTCKELAILRSWLTAIVLLAMIANGYSAAATEWQQYASDVAHTNYSNSSLDPKTLNFSWQAPTGFSEPVIANGAIYSLNRSLQVNGTFTISSFKPASGQTNWSVTGAYSSPSSLAYADGMLVYYASSNDFNQPAQLIVRDAATGALRYSVNFDQSQGSRQNSTPLLTKDSAGKLVAYFASSGRMNAVAIGANSGSVLWSKPAPNGNSITGSLPSIVGNSIVVAEPGHFSAYDRTTGELNKFHVGTVTGGGGSSPLVDAARNQFYIFENYGSGGISDAVTAYSYNGSNSFSQIWQYTGLGTSATSNGGLDANGNVYTTDSSGNMVILGPTGNVIKTLTGQAFATGMAAELSDNALYTFTDTQTKIYDLGSLTVEKTIDYSRGNTLTTLFKGIGPITDSYLLIDHAKGTNNSPGFRVYEGQSVPEPTVMPGFFLALCGMLTRRRRAVSCRIEVR